MNLNNEWHYSTKNIFKSKLKTALQEMGHKEIESRLREKKLSIFTTELINTPEFYVNAVCASERSGISWARLGGWIWQGDKIETGKRTCPLCGTLDSLKHIVADCIGLERVVDTLTDVDDQMRSNHGLSFLR